MIVTVLRDTMVIDHEMRRQVIRVASVHKEMLSESFGYVRVSQFRENTARELSSAVDALQDANDGLLDGLFLDLTHMTQAEYGPDTTAVHALGEIVVGVGRVRFVGVHEQKETSRVRPGEPLLDGREGSGDNVSSRIGSCNKSSSDWPGASAAGRRR